VVVRSGCDELLEASVGVGEGFEVSDGNEVDNVLEDFGWEIEKVNGI
jgi:hypothetical protein